MVLKEIIGNHVTPLGDQTCRWGVFSNKYLLFSIFLHPVWPKVALLSCHAESPSVIKIIQQPQGLAPGTGLFAGTDGGVETDHIRTHQRGRPGLGHLESLGLICGNLWPMGIQTIRSKVLCANVSPHWTTTPMSSVRSCKASCHSDAFSQALSREFMVIKVGCRRLLWISSSKCKFRGQASSWRPWIGTVACLAKSVPLFEGPILVPVHSGSPLWPKSYRIHTKNGCITVWHHCWVVIYSKNRSCKL